MRDRRARSQGPRTAPRAAHRGCARQRCRSQSSRSRPRRAGAGVRIRSWVAWKKRREEPQFLAFAPRANYNQSPHVPSRSPAHDAFETLILATYFFVLVILAVYGWHRYYLVYLYMKNKGKQPIPAGPLDALPVGHDPAPDLQRDVRRRSAHRRRLSDRSIRASCSRSRCSMTRPTRRAAWPSRPCGASASQGIDITYIHRTDRTGYKAGALEAGLKVAKGEFVAIFDADFIPTPDFLMRTGALLHRSADGHGPGALGAHQSGLLAADEDSVDPARWPLRARARRPQSRRATSSTSTARPGIWRREAIVDAGGWQHDTLTEDLDLSYRAQLRGWRFVFLPDLIAPAEVPVEMNSFKSQQHRWAKGSIQTCRKLLPRILRVERCRSA